MTLSLYEVTIPVFIRAFGNLSKIIEKGRAFADERGLEHNELLEARLFADMLPLAGQVQRASDTAKFVPVRVGHIPNVAMADTEASLDELQARIVATVRFLEAVPAAALDGGEDAEVVLKLGGNSVPFTGKSYVLTFAIPNFFFHVTTAYDILRHKGVPVGKLDFLAGR